MIKQPARTDGLGTIRPCAPDDHDKVVAVINAAAQAYQGVIPADRWQEPYMPSQELASEIADGVVFSGVWSGGRLIAVMGVQRRSNVILVRHAYVLPGEQGRGVGAALLHHLCRGAERPVLVGTWRAATWAIRFYERHGFAQVRDDDIGPLLRTYWAVPERQVATSVVLAAPPLVGNAAGRLIAGAGAGPDPR